MLLRKITSQKYAKNLILPKFSAYFLRNRLLFPVYWQYMMPDVG